MILETEVLDESSIEPALLATDESIFTELARELYVDVVMAYRGIRNYLRK